jgi:hypothetical protein
MRMHSSIERKEHSLEFIVCEVHGNQKFPRKHMVCVWCGKIKVRFGLS